MRIDVLSSLSIYKLDDLAAGDVAHLLRIDVKKLAWLDLPVVGVAARLPVAGDRARLQREAHHALGRLVSPQIWASATNKSHRYYNPLGALSYLAPS